MGWYDSLAGAADEAAGDLDETVGQRTDYSGAIEDASTPTEGFWRGATGALNFTVASLPGAVDDPQEQFVARGAAREGIDWAVDYEGEWGGREDQHDVVGPSFDWRDLGTGDGESAIDWRSDKSKENDPTSPQNNWLVKWLTENPTKAVLAGIALYLVPALGSVADATASVAGGTNE